MSTRILTMGSLDPVRSQAVYHALARSVTAGQDPTIALARPAQPYASLGYHVSMAAVDGAYCHGENLPVYRRRIGGGLVYLDSDQLFVQFCSDELPRAKARTYPVLMDPLVGALGNLGLDGGLSEGYDLTVGGDKIGGIGGGRIDGASAITTSILLDFDWERATRIHDTPTDRFRETLRRSMEREVTSLRRECDTPPTYRRVHDTVLRNVEEAFPAPYHGELTEHERTLVAEEIETLEDDDFRYLIDEPPGERRIKVSDGVYLREVDAHIAGQRRSVILEEREGTVVGIETVSDDLPWLSERFAGRPVDEVSATLRSETAGRQDA